MANTNIQAINFSNNMARRMADSMAQNYYTAKAIVNFWNANTVSAIIPNDSVTISDGAATDGRQIVTDAAITAIVTRAQEIITDYEATSNAKLNTVLAVAVNTQSHI